MLSCVLLHLGEPLFKIQFSFHPDSPGNGSVRIVDHHALDLLHIQHPYAAAVTDQYPCICALSSALRKKGSSVKNYLISFLISFTGEDRSYKFPDITVLVK